MARITDKSRYKEFGFVAYYEYDIANRSIDSEPKRQTVTPLLRSTYYRSLLELITHTVRQGEDMHRLALQYYGDAKMWWFIADYNPLVDCNDLKEGDYVLIPPNTEVNSY